MQVFVELIVLITRSLRSAENNPISSCDYFGFVFSVMASHSNQSPKVLGPLSSMFSDEARAAILAEEQAEAAQHTADIETENAADAVAAADSVESARAPLGSVGLPAQHSLRVCTLALEPEPKCARIVCLSVRVPGERMCECTSLFV